MKRVSHSVANAAIHENGHGGVITARPYLCTNYYSKAKICPEVEEYEDLPKAQLCVDTIRRAIVSIHLMDTATGELIRCGAGCVVDSSRGLILTGGQILRRPKMYIRRRQKNKDKRTSSAKKEAPSASSPTMIPIIQIPVPRTHKSDSSSIPGEDTTSSRMKYQYFTASIMMYHIANNQEICVLTLGQYVEPAAHSGYYDECTKINTMNNKEQKKKSFVSKLWSILGGLSLSLGCTDCQRHKKFLPLPLATKPVSKAQMKSLHEIRIAGGNSTVVKGTDTGNMNIQDPDLAMTGYFEGRRSPFWASSTSDSEFINLRITKTRDSDPLPRPGDSGIIMQTILSLGTEMVGSSFINGDGVLTGMVCKRIYMEAGFVSTCSASYHVSEAHLLKKMVKRAQKKYDATCLGSK